MICINPALDSNAAMPFSIDRPEENLSLAEMTEVAIESLYNEKSDGKGFFIMIEGGKIDWACHANDGATVIHEVIDFDNAVGKALAFYERHAKETLVVVTGDHETGGMSIGHPTTGYLAFYDRLFAQKKSSHSFQTSEWASHKAVYRAGYVHTNRGNLLDNGMIGLMAHFFGLTYSTLNDYQKEKLEDAYDKSMCGKNDNSEAENVFLYGGNEPIRRRKSINHRY